MMVAEDKVPQVINTPDAMGRASTCRSCYWVGKVGQLMAKGVLRCPNCGSENVAVLANPPPERLQ